jgi:hypothetical protein
LVVKVTGGVNLALQGPWKRPDRVV